MILSYFEEISDGLANSIILWPFISLGYISIAIALAIIYYIRKLYLYVKGLYHFSDASVYEWSPNRIKYDEDPDEILLHRYPNGWLPIIDSTDLKKNQIKPLTVAGKDIVVFRGASGKIHTLDAYCSHLGANLGVGGTVIDDEVRCPFHGWKWNGEGSCTFIPGIDCNQLPNVKQKVWKNVEINQLVYVWHHHDGKDPSWFPTEVKGIDQNKLINRGKSVHRIKCHIQDIFERTADVEYFNNSSKELEKIQKNSKFYWLFRSRFNMVESKILDWRVHKRESKSHIVDMFHQAVFEFFGQKFSLSTIYHITGPAVAHITIYVDCFGQKYFLYIKQYVAQTILWEEPLEIVNRIYTTESGLRIWLLSKLILFLFFKQIDQMAIILNNKKFLPKPFFTEKDTYLKNYRDWYYQFYKDKETIQEL